MIWIVVIVLGKQTLKVMWRLISMERFERREEELWMADRMRGGQETMRS